MVGAYGNFLSQPMPHYASIGHGISTPFGTFLPPGARLAAYVRSAGVGDGDEWLQGAPLVQSLSDALSYARAGRGDIIAVLPGHSEDVGTDMMDNLVAGTKIVGLGSPDQDDAPTFNWAAATDKWTIDNKNCMFVNLRLTMDGANGVTEAVEVSAAGVKFVGNWIRAGTTASLHVATAFDIASGGDDFGFFGNYVWNDGDGITAIIFPGAAVARLRVHDNEFHCHQAADNSGIIHIAQACTSLSIMRNYLNQSRPTGVAGIRFTDVAATGLCAHNIVGVQNNGTANAQGISIAGSTSLAVRFLDNYSTDENGRSGVITPAVVAT